MITIAMATAVYFLGSAFAWETYCEGTRNPKLSEAVFCAGWSWMGIVWAIAIGFLEDNGCD